MSSFHDGIEFRSNQYKSWQVGRLFSCLLCRASVYTVYTCFRSKIFWSFVARVHRTASFMVQVLKISLLGHRKRIIASLAERPYEEPPVKPPRLSQIRVRTVFIAFYSWNRICINKAKSTCLSLQCHDLPVSQSSSPLSQMEPGTGRSMDPLLPIGESGRKKVPEADFEVPHKHQSERHRSCVRTTSALLGLPGWQASSWTLHYSGQNWMIWLFFRSGMTRSPENPVWPWGHLVWRRPTPWSRTGIINRRSSSLNLVLMKPVYVLILHHPEWRSLHSATNSRTKMSPSLLQYLGSMLIKDLRGTESTQDACAKMRVSVVNLCKFINFDSVRYFIFIPNFFIFYILFGSNYPSLHPKLIIRLNLSCFTQYVM